MRNIYLLPHTPKHLRKLFESAGAYERSFKIKVARGVRDFLIGPEVSAEFLARLRSPAKADVWKDGFAVVHRAENIVIGLCSFTGPPSADGTAEIAYGIAPEYQGRGFATEAAMELIEYARKSARVRNLCAHTLPEHNASTRVLQKCGFTLVGKAVHPDDGVVWRWELPADLLGEEDCLTTQKPAVEQRDY